MLITLKRFILKPIYRLFIIRIFLLAPHRFNWYNSVPATLLLKVGTTHGVFTFNFKKDARIKGRRLNDRFFNTVMISLNVPKDTALIMPELANIILVAVKIKIWKIDYVILAEVLTDIYLDRFLECFKKT